MPIAFLEFPKIARFSREVIITEKIDGTNAQVAIVKTETGVDPCPYHRLMFANGTPSEL